MEKLSKEELVSCSGGMYFSVFTNILISIVNVVKLVKLVKGWRR